MDQQEQEKLIAALRRVDSIVQNARLTRSDHSQILADMQLINNACFKLPSVLHKLQEEGEGDCEER